MAKTLEDWQDAYYERQANHTEATGMLAQERDSWKRKYESACADADAATREARTERVEVLARLEANIRADERLLADAENEALRERIASLEQLASELHTENADLVTHNAALREALRWASLYVPTSAKIRPSIDAALAPTVPARCTDPPGAEPDTGDPCIDDPRAPHGFDRNASHSAGCYVCKCASWSPPHAVVHGQQSADSETSKQPQPGWTS